MSIDWKIIDALLDTLPNSAYCPLTFLVSRQCFDDITNQIFEKIFLKHISVKNLDDLHFEKQYNAVTFLKIGADSSQILLQQELLYLRLGNLIEASAPIIAIIEKETFNEKVEGRIKALLRRGVTEEIYES